MSQFVKITEEQILREDLPFIWQCYHCFKTTSNMVPSHVVRKYVKVKGFGKLLDTIPCPFCGKDNYKMPLSFLKGFGPIINRREDVDKEPTIPFVEDWFHISIK